MKGMLMKAIRAARGEHLPRGPTLFRPRWYFIFRLPFPSVLPLFSHLPSPSRFKGLLWKWFHSFFYFFCFSSLEISHQRWSWTGRLSLLVFSSRAPDDSLLHNRKKIYIKCSTLWLHMHLFFIRVTFGPSGLPVTVGKRHKYLAVYRPHLSSTPGDSKIIMFPKKNKQSRQEEKSLLFSWIISFAPNVKNTLILKVYMKLNKK